MSETTESICGYKPEMEIVEKFLSKHKDGLYLSEPKAKRLKPTTPKGKQKKGKTLPYKPKLNYDYTGKSISHFKFNGKRYDVKYWIEILINICTILASEYKREFEKVLELVGRKRPYFTKNPNELRVPR